MFAILCELSENSEQFEFWVQTPDNNNNNSYVKNFNFRL